MKSQLRSSSSLQTYIFLKVLGYFFTLFLEFGVISMLFSWCRHSWTVGHSDYFCLNTCFHTKKAFTARFSAGLYKMSFFLHLKLLLRFSNEAFNVCSHILWRHHPKNKFLDKILNYLSPTSRMSRILWLLFVNIHSKLSNLECMFKQGGRERGEWASSAGENKAVNQKNGYTLIVSRQHKLTQLGKILQERATDFVWIQPAQHLNVAL